MWITIGEGSSKLKTMARQKAEAANIQALVVYKPRIGFDRIDLADGALILPYWEQQLESRLHVLAALLRRIPLLAVNTLTNGDVVHDVQLEAVNREVLWKVAIGDAT